MLHTLTELGREAQRTGAWDDALAHFETALALIAAGGDPKVQADLLRWSGMVHAERGAPEEAITLFEQSKRVSKEAGLEDEIAAAEMCLGNVELLRGSLDRASASFLKSRKMAEGTGNDRLVAQADQNLGTIANIQGNVAIALLSYRSALERYRRVGDEFTATRALNNMGMAHVDLLEWEAAETCFEEASALAGRTGDTMMEGQVELNKAELHIKRQRYEAATESLDRSLHVFHRLRTKRGIAEAYKAYGVIYREMGRPEQADTHFALSLGMAEACQDRLLQAETQMEWALLQLQEDRKQEAILYLNRSLKIFQDLKAAREVLDIERKLDRLKEMYLPAVKGWGAHLSEQKDPYQIGHAQRVADYASKLAREVGVDGWDLTYLRIGAYIHDLGNMAVPAEVLNKTDALDEHERELMKLHTLMGEAMAKQLAFADQVRPIVRSHHEQWAGGGYPDRLVGEEIPLGARVVAIVDVFDALTNARSFRGGYSRDEALGIMERDAERMFDPTLFGIFVDMVRRGALDAPTSPLPVAPASPSLGARGGD